MVQSIQIKRTPTANNPPATLVQGELAVGMGDFPAPKLWVGTPSGVKEITSGALAFIGDAAPATPLQGQLWWESATGFLYIWYNDGTSSQWVQIN